MVGNLFIVAIVSMNRKFHKPMYFFLCNLAVIDICFTNTTVPNMLKVLIGKGKSISLHFCLIQMYTFFVTGTAEFLLLAVMSVDRYLAICYPLHYITIMQRRVCIQLIAGIWLVSLLSICAPATLIMRLTFCFNEIDHFFCDVGQLLQNSCADTSKIQIIIVANSSILIVSFLVTCVSYINIILVASKILSEGGRGKVLSTCLSHAIVVTLAYGSCIFMYLRPKPGQNFTFDKKVAILNTVVVPLINPFIYTMRNQDVKELFQDWVTIYSNK
ncbi:hypothetical protein XELAEV_18007516mg [Xenopus laevis]|uniref:Olfactory receptor n=1 Tax=Xenopus laevis TaxID=8355 RepID=A0A974E0U7_XENLA|nr:hypothetical protein XELAEV_18007516mg [Xenopus laevis]